jgi:hypothetical protein
MPKQLLTSLVPSFPLEGLVMGYNSLEIVLLSSLSYFYSLICINNIRLTLESFLFDPKDVHNTVTAFQLNDSLLRFNVNDMIETLAFEMLIES